jgi:hypothetical protein
MNKINIGNNIYFEAYLACPVCHERGKNGAATYWEHYGCGGQMYLGDDANYYCASCKQRSHVGKWKYGCPDHSNAGSDELDFQFASNAALASVISCAGQLTTAAGVPWLQKFLQNLGA